MNINDIINNIKFKPIDKNLYTINSFLEICLLEFDIGAYAIITINEKNSSKITKE